jgi:hypothetical protein
MYETRRLGRESKFSMHMDEMDIILSSLGEQEEYEFSWAGDMGDERCMWGIVLGEKTVTLLVNRRVHMTTILDSFECILTFLNGRT